ncbi:S8 family serine peptidase [Streptomyces bacillaris]|uniref:S8 family serine peptidase n=1 Tax=Streptomyces bacillaris TaxID=68179 RepID=UPI0036738CC2
MGCFVPERPGESDAPDIAYGTGGGDRRRDRTVRGAATARASRRPTGYDDSGTDSVPLIATYTADTARTAPLTPRGAERGQALRAIDGLALKADKKRIADFWADLTAPRSRSGAGLKKLWLDRKVRATLDRSTQQVGADRAWAAGYDGTGTGTKVAVLDTGADARHPDLDGRITASQNFTDSATTDDHQGHGTHVASTVGGSGTASGGKNKGVAPGADLLVGKVLADREVLPRRRSRPAPQARHHRLGQPGRHGPRRGRRRGRGHPCRAGSGRGGGADRPGEGGRRRLQRPRPGTGRRGGRGHRPPGAPPLGR